MMEKQLYFIANQGCDATTYGIQEFTHEQFKFFCKTILNLNRNSHYGCMPIFYIYEASWDDFKEVTDQLNIEDIWEDGYVDLDNRFWFNGKCYTFKEEYFDYYTKYKLVNLEEVCNDE